MTQRIIIRGALGASLVAVLAAAVASATITVPSFAVTPATTQAGATSALTLDTKYSSNDGDSVRNATTALPAGLVLNATVVPTLCTDQELNANACPSDTLAGSSVTSGTLGGSQISSPGKVYLVAPHSGEAFRLGIVSTTPAGNVTAEAAVTGNIPSGFNIVFTDIPNSQFGLSIQITESQLSLNGTVDGQPFVTNPTKCTPAASKLTAASWNDPTPVTANSSFTPTGCATTPSHPAPKKKKHKKHRRH